MKLKILLNEIEHENFSILQEVSFTTFKTIILKVFEIAKTFKLIKF